MNSEINNNIVNNEIIDNQNKLNIVFFDEYNTCNSQGLFIEIMCKGNVHGKKIKDNVI